MHKFPLCKLHSLRLFNQNINSMILKHCMTTLYNNVAFSLFPYKLNHVSDSQQAVQQYNSGNCIAMTRFLKEFLLKNYGIFSYIIPASVPNMFKLQGTRHLTHVALLIPKSKVSFMIMDPALYFLEPIVVSTTKYGHQVPIKSVNIYDDMTHDIFAELNNVSDPYVGDGQSLLENSKRVSCYYRNYPNDVCSNNKS